MTGQQVVRPVIRTNAETATIMAGCREVFFSLFLIFIFLSDTGERTKRGKEGFIHDAIVS